MDKITQLPRQPAQVTVGGAHRLLTEDFLHNLLECPCNTNAVFLQNSDPRQNKRGSCHPHYACYSLDLECPQSLIRSEVGLLEGDRISGDDQSHFDELLARCAVKRLALLGVMRKLWRAHLPPRLLPFLSLCFPANMK